MSRSTEKFARFLTEGVHRIRLREAKTIQVVQDELGYALGREGESAIEYWRKGHLPPKLGDIEKLARLIVTRGRLERDWLEQCRYTRGHHSRHHTPHQRKREHLLREECRRER